jgi:IclR family transcriptional regulator, KDG regulon repressor
LSDSVRSVERALDILLCFTAEKPALSLTQIAEQVGMHKSTTHRLLSTLEAKRFINRDKSTGMYRLGFLTVEMASIVLQDNDIQRWALPYLQHLSALSGETVDLAVLDNDHVVYLQVVESLQRVKIAAAIGERLPVHCTATGKAFLAYLPESEVTRILTGGMAKYTECTLSTPDDLHQELLAVRQHGYAISSQEYEHDINAVAAPILNSTEDPIAVIAIVGPSYRLTQECMLRLGPDIQDTAAAIANEVGMAALSVMIPQKREYQNDIFSKS